MGLLDKISYNFFLASVWPWNEETHPAIYSPNINWPKISIITPSYNQGKFIEETIRSVLLQNYPNLEYIIIDGGSTDNTIEIIKKYEKWITYWVSEKDNGQSEAINKGFSRSKGDIIYWLNSDDSLMKDALYKVAISFMNGNKIILGRVKFTDANGFLIRMLNNSTFTHKSLLKSWVPTYVPSQPGIFFASSLIHSDELVRNDLNFCMDYELWLRISESVKVDFIGDCLANYRVHDQSKTGVSNNFETFLPELEEIRGEYFNRLSWGNKIILIVEEKIVEGYRMTRRIGSMVINKGLKR